MLNHSSFSAHNALLTGFDFLILRLGFLLINDIGLWFFFPFCLCFYFPIWNWVMLATSNELGSFYLLLSPGIVCCMEFWIS